MRYLYLFILIIFFTSCVTERKVVTYLNEHPEVAAAYCADEFPVDTQYIKGETIVVTDSIVTPGDSVECPPVDQWTKPVKVKCPDTWVVTKEVTRIDTLVKENTARVKQLELEGYQKDKLQHDTEQELQKTKEQSSSRLKACIGLSLLIVLYILYRVGKAYIKRRIPLNL